LKVLIIEDDSEIIEIISLAFKLCLPQAQLLSTNLGEEGLMMVEKQSPDVVLLDLGLPDTNGFEVLKQIRLFSDVPVVILTVRGSETDVVKGLQYGADDYIVKPFRQMEMLARIQSVIRRQHPAEEKPIEVGSIHLEPGLRRCYYNNKEIPLTRTECLILTHMLQNAGHVVSHSNLAETIWGDDYPGASHNIRVYIQRLREKLEEHPEEPRIIKTKVGIGYILAKP